MNIIKKANVSKTTLVQTKRKTHEALAALIHQSPKAAALLHILISRIGDNNAVVVSHKVLAQLMLVKSITTVKQAIKILEGENWIEIRRVGDRGTVNAYVLNNHVAWTKPRDNLRYSLFSATVITSSYEQPDKDQLENQEPLRKLPNVHELQIPYGDI